MARAAAWGVAPGYHDIDGRWVAADPKTVASVLDAMHADGQEPPPATARVVRAGDPLSLPEGSEVATEDGCVLSAAEAMAAGLPAGYHTLRHAGSGAESRLIVSPGRCHLRPDLRAWGWAIQLYALRSGQSWGQGDLADLREVGRWATGLGARALFVNPLYAPLPIVPQEASPYYPSSRLFRSPLYIRVEEVPRAAELGEGLARLAAAGRALNGTRLIDRDEVYRLKMAALEELFAAFPGSPEFDRYRLAQGGPLEDYAVFCALSEVHGVPWHDWPARLR